VDEGRGAAGFDFFAEAGDENLDGAGVVFVVALPDALTEFGAGKNAAGLLEDDLYYFVTSRSISAQIFTGKVTQ